MISIIIASLNCSQSLMRCLKSIWEQTYEHKQLIVMDGGSTDGSVEILMAHQDKITYWDSGPDRGIYHAWNKALAHANGEWICFLGADDYFWKPQVLEELRPHLIKAEEQNIRIVYGKIAKLDDKGHVVTTAGKPWKKIHWQMRHGMPVSLPHSGLMHHRKLFEDHGLFDESFKIAGDYEFLLRELKTNHALYADGILTVGFQMGGTADSSPVQSHWEIARARQKNGLRRLSWLWAVVYIRAILRGLWVKSHKRQLLWPHQS
jgi:glycosyltransferase involved in cell wall biosynthesis